MYAERVKFENPNFHSLNKISMWNKQSNNLKTTFENPEKVFLFLFYFDFNFGTLFSAFQNQCINEKCLSQRRKNMCPLNMLSEVDMMPPHTISISPTDKFIFYNTNAVESSLFCEFFCFLFYYSVSMEYMFLIICLRRLDETHII